MKSHYTIISAVVRPEIQEKISIGLLLVSATGLHFSCSKNKLTVVRSLIDKSLYRFLNDTIRQIDLAIEAEIANKGTIFTSSDHPVQFSEGYLSYMNRYSNNLISFSSPVQIEMEADQKLFDFLFSKYIDATEAAPKRTKSVEVIKSEFLPKVNTHFNIERELTRNDIPDLLMSVNVDMIGKNEVPVFSQIIDFERNINFIQQDVAVLEFLCNAFEKQKPKSFLVGNEPDKSAYPKSHAAWNDMRNYSKFDFVEMEEIERVKVYAEEHEVQPLLK
jgi:hypothetical protein